MRTAILTLLLAAAPAFAGPSGLARQGDDWVRIKALACTNAAVIAQIHKANQDEHAFLWAEGHFGGKDFAACWEPTSFGIHVIYEDGDQGLIPAEAIKPDPEV